MRRRCADIGLCFATHSRSVVASLRQRCSSLVVRAQVVGVLVRSRSAKSSRLRRQSRLFTLRVVVNKLVLFTSRWKLCCYATTPMLQYLTRVTCSCLASCGTCTIAVMVPHTTRVVRRSPSAGVPVCKAKCICLHMPGMFQREPNRSRVMVGLVTRLTILREFSRT